MDTRQANMLEVHHNVRAFLDEHADKLGGIATTGMRQELDDALVDLTHFATGQATYILVAKGTTQKYRARRAALRHDHMGHVAGVAQAMLPRLPELQPLRMPKARPSADKLWIAAYAMAEAAQPFSDVFMTGGLPTDFLAQLTGALVALVAPVTPVAPARTAA